MTNTPEVLTETTADFAWALLMAVAHRLPISPAASIETRLKMTTRAVENCLAVLEGAPPLTPVNPEVLTT